MDTRNRISVMLAFGIALAAFSSGACAATPPKWNTGCGSDPGDHKIDVGTEVSCKLAVVSKSKANTVTWRSIDTARPNVKIVFDDPDAFKNIKDCDGLHAQCNSGAPTRPGNPNWVYLYKAYTCDKDGVTCSNPVDPGIIINP